MSHGFLYGHDVSTRLVQVQSESMTEAVKVEAFIAKPGKTKLFYESVIYCLLAYMLSLLTWEQPTVFFCIGIVCADVCDKILKSLFGKNCISVRAVFAPGDVDAVFGTDYITTFKAAQFTDSYSGRIKKSNLRFMLRVVKGIDYRGYFLAGRYNRKLFIKVKKGNFVTIPIPVQYVIEEIPKLGDMHIYRTVVKTPDIFQEPHIGSDLCPCDIMHIVTGKI